MARDSSAVSNDLFGHVPLSPLPEGEGDQGASLPCLKRSLGHALGRAPHSADARQGIADQHVHDPGAPELRLQQHQTGWLVLDDANDGRLLP